MHAAFVEKKSAVAYLLHNSITQLDQARCQRSRVGRAAKASLSLMCTRSSGAYAVAPIAQQAIKISAVAVDQVHAEAYNSSHLSTVACHVHFRSGSSRIAQEGATARQMSDCVAT